MFISKKMADLQAKVAELTAENTQMKEQLARYRAEEELQREAERRWSEQFSGMMNYTGLEGKNEG